jgi:putative tricarboxylic transport membrane protein
MARMTARNRIGTIFWLLLGIYIAIHAYGMGIGRLRQPGPGFIFFLASLLVVGLTGIELIRTFTSPVPEKESSPLFKGVRWGKILLVLAGLSVYALIFNAAGFKVSTFLLMMFLFKVVEPTRWSIALLSSLATTIFSYFLFEMWLDVPFPKGFLEF